MQAVVDARAQRKENWIILGVCTLGGLIVIPCLLALIGSADFSFGGNVSSANGFGTFIDLCYLALGAGLILRRETARQIYLILGVLGILLFAAATLIDDNTTTPSRAPAIASLETQISQVERDQQNSIAFKTRTVENLRRQLLVERARENDGHAKKPSPVPGLLLAFAPLVFLTRPSVRKVFD